ncbi:hypothetical protein K503DRAFT_772829, partial [Rhizopogon vinicolor AM-OR11-026]
VCVSYLLPLVVNSTITPQIPVTSRLHPIYSPSEGHNARTFTSHTSTTRRIICPCSYHIQNPPCKTVARSYQSCTTAHRRCSSCTRQKVGCSQITG